MPARPNRPGAQRVPGTERGGQRPHWETTYVAYPLMYGTETSEAGRRATETFRATGVQDIVELGCGHGRDTLGFLRAGLRVLALDYSATALAQLRAQAAAVGLSGRLVAAVHDVRQPLPCRDESVDGVFAHMLLCMDLTSGELDRIVAEVRRVLRPGGWFVYSVRHTGDAHFGAGHPHGDDRWEHGGFVVHFFGRGLVDRLATGMRLVDLTAFEEGDLPRRLWCVTLRKEG